jgi:hypothetical protein
VGEIVIVIHFFCMEADIFDDCDFTFTQLMDCADDDVADAIASKEHGLPKRLS